MKYFIELSYNGKNYHGWQVQPNATSIQEMVTDALSKILGVQTTIVGAGRTDTGVHAQQLFAHFDIENTLDEANTTNKLNALLPDDILVKSVFLVKNDTHARFSAISRSYEYRIWLGRNPFLLDTAYQLHRQQPDIKKMNEAASVLLETTNFKCFSKSKTDVTTYNCKIEEAKWTVDNELLIFHIRADRFLRNMVRAIVGTLLEIGLGKKTKEDFIAIIKSEDRSKAGVSVPPQGLFLTKVTYKKGLLVQKKRIERREKRQGQKLNVG